MKDGLPPVRNVLLVDDEEDSHFFFGRIYAKAQVAPPLVSINSGEDAIEYLMECAVGAKDFPYVAFLDIRMPCIDGFVVLDWIRSHGMLGRLVTVMVSTSDDPRDITHSFELGAHAYIGKNPSPETVRSLVSDAIRLFG